MFLIHLISFATLFGLASTTHVFTIYNKCSYAVNPIIANTNCGYSPRCDTPGSGGVPNPAISYNAPQPGNIAAGASKDVTINNQWNGRIFNQNGKCGAKGEQCTVLEYNLDTGDTWTPQSYDISNVQGFTQSVSIGANGCESTTCTAVDCPCSQAYPPGDTSGCGSDLPVRACGAGNVGFWVTFCP